MRPRPRHPSNLAPPRPCRAAHGHASPGRVHGHAPQLAAHRRGGPVVTDHGSTISINSSALSEAPDPTGPGRAGRPQRRPHRHRHLDRPDAGRRRHPGLRRPPGVGRRRHRQLHPGRLPPHRRDARGPDAGAHQPRRAVADLRVPHPHVADPPRASGCGPTRSRCPTTSGASPPTPSARCGTRRRSLRCGTSSPSPSSTTTGPRRRGRSSSRWSSEAARIGYWNMVSQGQVRMTRRRYGGGYFTILTPPAGTTPTKRVAFRSTYVHLCVGYPGVAFLPDLQEYRTKYDDYVRVVNSYEPHEHVYEELRRRPGLVLIRGNGIVASRVLQRLIEDRDNYGLQTQILHLFRTYRTESFGRSIFERRVARNGWIYQGFNWPKSAWGGANKRKFEKLEGEPAGRVLQAPGRHHDAGPQGLEGAAGPGPAARAGTAPTSAPSTPWCPATTAPSSPGSTPRTAACSRCRPTSSSTPPGWRRTSGSTGSSPTSSTTAAPSSTPSAASTSSATSRSGAPRAGWARPTPWAP